jgi:putative ATPase
LEVDAIVNAANTRLAHGSGVAGAILSRGGDLIQEESNAWVAKHGCVPTGQAALTSAGRLPCRWVIHAVGPIWQDGNYGEDDLLSSAVTSSLRTAIDLGSRTIAIPAISSGIFGFPKERCARIIIAAIRAWDVASAIHLDEIRLTNIDTFTTNLFKQELASQIPQETQ